MTEDTPLDEPPAGDPLAREGEHVPPAAKVEAYHCPRCGVLAQMDWSELRYGYQGNMRAPAWRVTCGNCKRAQYWISDDDQLPRMVLPATGGGPRPHVDMPPDVRADYEEARGIVNTSPRGAVALLRLATQRLVNDHLQTEGGDLNDRIRLLVEKGLSPMIQQALDSLRVIGNEAVHPGTLDLRDDVETAASLFTLLNVIVEDRISRPKLIAEMYANLPAGKLQGIVDRDRPKT
jgi:hypothetical protein